MRGAKPSSGLVHLHKTFVEVHFAERTLPQNVSVVACIDGRQLSTVLPGQVYSTSCGADHWLLGLQLIFKSYKDPVITHVEKTGDNQITVSIATQGLQDKYHSNDPATRQELQQVLEAAAFKFAQTAIMRKEGRLQITGPNINIPKKQLRAQWPSILEKLAPQDVQAHIFVDSPDQYISCAAKIILTKAKAEPVFYLSGLSQLLKSYMGAFVTLELFSQEKVVRLNVDTGQSKAAGPSLSTTAGTPESAGDLDSAATPAKSLLARQSMQPAAADAAGAAASSGSAGVAPVGPAEQCRGRLSSDPGRKAGSITGKRTAAAAAGSPHSMSARDAAVSSDTAWRSAVAPADCMPDTRAGCQLRPSQQLLLWKDRQQQQEQLRLQYAAAAAAALGPAGFALQTSSPQQALPARLLEEMCSSSAAPWFSANITSAPAPGAAVVQAPSSMPALPEAAVPPSSMPGTPAASHVAGASGKSGQDAMLGPTAQPAVSVGSDAGLWLLADHAAQLQAVGSWGNFAAVDTGAAAHQQCSKSQQPAVSVSCRQEVEPGRPVSRVTDYKAAAGVNVGSVLSAAGPVAATESASAVAQAAASLAVSHPLLAACLAEKGEHTIHPAALPQGHVPLHSLGTAQQRTSTLDDCSARVDQHADAVAPKRRKTSANAAARVAAAGVGEDSDRRLPPIPSLQLDSALKALSTAMEADGLNSDSPACPPNSLAAPHKHYIDMALKQMVQERANAAKPSAAVAANSGSAAWHPCTEATVASGIATAVGALLSAAPAGPSTVGLSSDDMMYLAQQGELYGEGGAVAVIHRVSSQQQLMHAKQQVSAALAGPYTAAMKALASSGGSADWSPAQHCSPKSGASSASRHILPGITSAPSSCSPVIAALAAASAADAAAPSRDYSQYPGSARYTMEGPFLAGDASAASAAAGWYQEQHQQGTWQPSSLLASAAVGRRPLSSGFSGRYTTAAVADTAVDGGSVSQSLQLPQQQISGGGDTADLEWPELPDADNLMLVGKGLVQVMNLLGAGSTARLALTRSLRTLSVQDREWLLSITYPHLQDSCKRKALPEVKMILNEIAGVNCFAEGSV